MHCSKNLEIWVGFVVVVVFVVFCFVVVLKHRNIVRMYFVLILGVGCVAASNCLQQLTMICLVL